MDAVVASIPEAQSRLQALRAAGATVRSIVTRSDEHEDLLHGAGPERSASATPVVARAQLDAALAETVRTFHPDLVLHAGARPAELGATARGGIATRAWVTAFAPAGAARPSLEAFDDALHGLAGAAFDPESIRRARLSLWDGPYVVALTPLEGKEAE